MSGSGSAGLRRLGATTATLIVLAAGACENPQPPAACGAIPQVTVNAGETATVTACFDDPNGDMLSYSATSSNPSVATASISGTSITVSAVAPGNASVTVTATDPGGLQSQQNFQVTVPNRPPEPRGTIPSITIPVGRTETVDVSSYFTEPDGEALIYGATSSNPGAATVSVAGSTVTVTAVAKGTTDVTVTATDPGGLAATQTFQSMVPNRSPEPVGMIPDQTAAVGETVTIDLSAYFDDPDDDLLTYAAASSNSGVAMASVSGSIVTITAVAKGTTSVTVTATDPEGLAATQTFQSMVPNRPPEPVGTIPDQTAAVGETVTVDLSTYFDDPDGDPLAYAAASSDSGVARASVAGSIVTITAVAKGTTSVTVTATDPEGLAATQTFQSMVPNRPPEPAGTIPDQTANVGETVTVDLSPYFEDPDGDPLTYTAASSNSGVATASVSGSTVTITAVATGSATITVTARDPDGLASTQQAGVAVQQPNRAPSAVGTIPAMTLAPGDTATVDASGYFTDPDGDALTYTAMSSNSGVATASVSGSTVTITAVAAGSATITVTARDPDDLTATQQAGVAVQQPNRAPSAVGTIPAMTLAPGDTATVDASQYFSDPDGDALTYTATSSNSSVATASVSGSTVTITAVAAGSATITVTARDPDDLTATQQAGVTVQQPNRAPSAVGTIPAMTLAPGDTATVDASGYFTDPDGDALTYTATSSDSSVATASVSGSTVTITAVAAGSATITVTARDPDDLTATQQAGVTVQQPNRAPSAVGTIPAMTLAPGETATVDASGYFTDLDGDALTYTAMSSNSSVATASVSGSTVTITAVAAGSATITVTARDPDDLTATQQAGVTVQQPNRAPSAVGTIPAMTLAPGETATVDASGYFTDLDGDALTYTAMSSNSSVATASVSGSTVTITAVAAGSATITVTARDPGGLTATQQAGVTVTAGAGFRDDFNSSASLADWELFRATAVVNNGVLELTNTSTSNSGVAVRGLGSAITDWTIETRMGRKQTTNSLVNVRWATGHARFTLVDFLIGSITLDDINTNYSLWLYDSEEPEWVYLAAASGNSTAINDGAGELTTIRLSFIDGRLKGVAGNTELFNFETNDFATAIFRFVGAMGLVSEVTESGAVRTGLFDWIDVDGDPVGNSFLADESAILNGIDARELPKEGPDVGVLRVKSLEISGAVRKRRNQ